MFVNNPQLNLYHHNIVEQRRILTKERLEKYHNTLDRIEKEMLEDYNKRVERMKEVSVTPTTGKDIRRHIDIYA
jgi:nucleosome binding factor SPN SPT16 subunit